MNNRFPETLEYLYKQLPMFQREGQTAFKKDLTNTRELCWILGLPQWKIKTIHIAGTNGKGSTSSMIASVLQEAGYKVGLYTSPHLLSFTERIKINGKEISQRAVVDFVDELKPFIERIRPSFFELTVAMAFHHFDEEEVDIAVIETGMGGRLDSTNVLRPEICAITNISMDHQQFLGDTLAAIAGEKAGIIKPYTPVIIGKRHPETDDVFEAKGQEMNAEVRYAEDRFLATSSQASWSGQSISLQDLTNQEESHWNLDLAGQYQHENIQTAFSVLLRLMEDGWEIEEEHFQRGLANIRRNVGLRGRMECLAELPLTLCDVGHNEAGVRYVLEQLSVFAPEDMHIVWGMVSDKDHDNILRMLPAAASYYWVKPAVPRGYDASALKAKADQVGLSGQAYSTVRDGINAATDHASTHHVIFIGGSTFTVADALAVFPESTSHSETESRLTGKKG